MRWLFAAILMLVCGPVMALEPWYVWLDWKGAWTEVGGSVNVQVNQKPDGTVTLHDLIARTNRPDLYAEMSIRDLTLVPAKDGSVIAVLPAAPIKIKVSPHLANLEITVSLEGGQIRIAGTGDDRRYTLRLDAVDVAWTGWQGTLEAKRSGTIHGKDLRVDATRRGAEDYGYRLSAQKITYDISSNTPKLAEATQDAGAYHDLASQGSLVTPPNFWWVVTGSAMPQDRMQALRRQLKAGLAVSFSMTTGASESHTARTAKGRTALDWSDIQAGSMAMRFDKRGFAFDATEAGGTLAHTGDVLDAQFVFGPLAFGLTLPLLGEAFEPLRLVAHMKDIAMTPEWWARHDPAGKFPHDMLQVDLEARALMRGDVFRQILDGMMQRSDTPLPEFQTLALDRLSVSGFGASVEASAAFIVDNTGPRPLPIGKGEARLTGIYALLDGLQSQGFLSADQNMGARLMLISFFRPSDDLANELVARMEARGDGSVWVNGARMR